MKEYEKKQVTTEQECFKKMTCDLCGKESLGHNWREGTYKVKDTEISLEEGESYPDFRSTTKIEFDICPDCFKNKLIPWLEQQGAKGREKELVD